jgi:carbonic anhydrase
LVQRAIRNPEEAVARDVQRLRHSPAISPRFTLSGRVYDVTTGLVSTVVPPGHVTWPVG